MKLVKIHKADARESFLSHRNDADLPRQIIKASGMMESLGNFLKSACLKQAYDYGNSTNPADWKSADDAISRLTENLGKVLDGVESVRKQFEVGRKTR